MNINRQNATNDLGKPHKLKEAFVVLPGHPFYGLKVEILQQGKTDSHEWCLIKHPKHPDFNYRISRRWLESQPLPEKKLQTYKENEIALPFSQLQKLVQFVHCKLNPINSSVSDKDIVGCAQQAMTGSKLNDTNIRENYSGNMGEYSSDSERKICIKTSMDLNNTKQKEV